MGRAPLLVTANSAAKAHDGRPYSGGNGVIYTGFVAGDPSNVLAGSLVYVGSSQGATNPGLFSITAAGLAASNYDLRYVNGTLKITAYVQPMFVPAPEWLSLTLQPIASFPQPKFRYGGQWLPEAVITAPWTSEKMNVSNAARE